MIYYLKLQYIRLSRWLENLGIHPILGLIIGLVIFVVLSKLLFMKTDYAKWIFLFIAVLFTFKLGDLTRNDQLRNIFDPKEYRNLRIIENVLVTIPFIVYFSFEMEFILALSLPILAIILSFISINQIWNKTIPTPFKKFPFEFIVGFRKTYWLIAIVYFLIFKAIQVGNYNLGLFGLVAIFLCSMAYFQKPESEYFVWIHTHNSTDFLRKKFYNAAVCVSIVSIIGLIGILIGFPYKWAITLLVFLLGYVFVGSMILAKYSAFPHEMNLPQALWYVISLLFPPMLLITIWIFYSKSKKRLKPILEC